MKRWLLGLTMILAVSGCAAIAQDKNHQQGNTQENNGFGPEINAVLVAAGLGFAGWLGNQTARWGVQSQEGKLRSEILEIAEAKAKAAIADAQKLEDERIGRRLDAIQQTLHNLSGKLDDSKASIERRLKHCEDEVRSVEGNIESIVPKVNQIIERTFGNYGVTPAGQILVRKNGPPSNPALYSTEGYLE